MLDQIIGRLETADEFERHAKRLLESGSRPPNWTHTYIECLGDASRERTIARELVLLAHKTSDQGNRSTEGAKADESSSDIGGMTLRQVLRLVDAARSSPAGSQRMRKAARRLSQVAACLHDNDAMAQLLWWNPDLQPVPPGRPVIDFDRRKAGQ